MKLNYLLLLLSTITTFAQKINVDSIVSRNKILEKQFKKLQADSLDNINSTVITINLSQPTSRSIENNNRKKKLVVKKHSPLAIRLIGGNPLKYEYKLNYKTVNLFESSNFLNFTDSKGLFNQSKVSEDPNRYYRDGDYSEDENLVDQFELIGINQELIIDDLKVLNKKVESYKIQLAKKEELDDTDLKLKINEFKVDLYNIIDENIKIKKQIKYFSLPEIEDEIVSDYELVISKQDTINGNIKERSVQKFNNQLKTFYEQQTIIDQKLEESVLHLEELSTLIVRNFILPIDLEGLNIDYVEVTLHRKEISTTKTEVYTYRIWITGGLKFDVSAGLFITNLLDRQYYLQDDAETAGNKFIRQENIGDFNYGVGTMLNVTSRSGSWFRPGIGIGVLLTNNQKFQGMTGAHLVVGKEQRIIIHYGLVMGKVETLSSRYKENTSYALDFQDSESIPTVDKFEFGQFFGVTYDFGKPKGKDDILSSLKFDN